MFRRTFCVIGASTLCGCTPIATPVGPDGQPIAEPVILRESKDCMVTILLDLSGSFEHLMTDQGKAYHFSIDVADRCFRDSIGSNNQLVIAQISGNDRTLLWQGTPTQLRRDFSSPQQFNSFLKSRSIPSASLVFDSIAKTLDYVSSDPDVASGHARSAVLVLSDMQETGPTPGESLRRMKESLARYGQRGGAFGAYFVDQNLIAAWRNELSKSGIRHSCVEGDFTGNPQLPSFD